MKKYILKKFKKKQISISAFLLALPLTCFAGGSTPEDIIQNIIDYATGNLARVVGVAVIVGSGYAFLSHHAIEKKTFIRIATGMGLILGGSTLADMWWSA